MQTNAFELLRTADPWVSYGYPSRSSSFKLNRTNLHSYKGSNLFTTAVTNLLGDTQHALHDVVMRWHHSAYLSKMMMLSRFVLGLMWLTASDGADSWYAPRYSTTTTVRILQKSLNKTILDSASKTVSNKNQTAVGSPRVRLQFQVTTQCWVKKTAPESENDVSTRNVWYWCKSYKYCLIGISIYILLEHVLKSALDCSCTGLWSRW